jgi:transcriptional regulator with XRE-family HTH domain
VSESNLLGEYLRACRERITPSEIGFTALGRRRVVGLRREEVALLAGISPNYYLRLEQGRDRHPSEQVVESLARALRLDAVASAHLLDLARPRASAGAGPRLASVPTSIVQLLNTLSLPAFVQDKHFDVLESNAPARALSPTLRTGQNRLRSMFLDPAERRLFVDWPEVAEHLVGSFRASVAADADDQRTRDLVNELSTADTHFHELWAHYRVVGRVDRPPVRLAHPVVGRLTLTRDNLAVDGPDTLRLMIYHAEPGSDDLARLMRLSG